jgi:exonuclease III
MSVANVSNDIIVEVSSAQEDIISKTQNRKNKRNKRELKLGTWNLQGTGQSLKLEHLVSDLKRYNVDICGLQETRKSSTYHQILGDYHLLFLEYEEHGYLGLGFAVHKKLWSSAYRYHIHSKNIAQLDLQMGNYWITCLSVHAPTLQKSQQDPALRATFYNGLSSIAKKIPKRNEFFILGDFNAKTGKNSNLLPDIQDTSSCLGSHAKGKRNTNGDALIAFALEQRLFLTNTAFKKNAGKQATWHCFASKMQTINGVKKRHHFIVWNQIDYILCRQSQRHRLRNAEAKNPLST